MKTLGTYVVIKPINEEMRTASGMIISSEDAGNIRYKRANIVSVGADCNKEVINEGDNVYYDKTQGFTMVLNKEVYTIIKERDIFIVLDSCSSS
jgi:co-chaperonin GroES (HSP10)